MERILELVNKIVNPEKEISMERLERLLRMTPADMYKQLCRLGRFSTGYLSRRIGARVSDIRRTVPRIDPSGIYLDLGGGDGKISRGVGANFGFKNIVSADIETPFTMTQRRDARGVRYLTIRSDKGEIPLPSKSCSFVTALMVLHHIHPDILDKELKEIRRVLKPGGILFIREHDRRSEEDSQIIDIEHLLYEFGAPYGQDLCKPYSPGYRAWYRSTREWASLLERYGFKAGNIYIKGDGGPTRYYSQAFRAL